MRLAMWLWVVLSNTIACSDYVFSSREMKQTWRFAKPTKNPTAQAVGKDPYEDSPFRSLARIS